MWSILQEKRETGRLFKYHMEDGRKGQKAYFILTMGLLLSGCLISVLMAFWGCRYSYYSQRDYSQHILLVKDSTLMHLLLFLAVCAVMWGADWLLRTKMSLEVQGKISLALFCAAAVWMLAAGAFFVMSHPYYPVGDQLNVTAGAYYNRQGDFSMLQPGGYVGMYQQQKGFMFLYEILYALFGDFCYDKAQLFHVVFAEMTLVSGYLLLKQNSDRVIYRILFCLFMMSCVPLMIYLPYIYGDVPAICFTMILFLALNAYGKTMRKRYAAAAAVAASLALLCRMNTWIVLIAVGIGMVLLAIQKWNYRPLIAGFCIVLAAGSTVKAVDKMYELRSGYESGIGIPSILWVAMGLQETDGLAGVYNRYQQTVFAEAQFEPVQAAQVGKEYIRLRMNEFANDIPMAVDFFKRKVQSQWLEPLFESMYATETFDEEKTVVPWIADLYYGELHDTVWKVSNYYQSVALCAMLLFVIGELTRLGKPERNAVQWIPLITMVGGFLFSLMWENQCRYCLPYYVYMMLFVPEGILQLGDWIARIVQYIRYRRNGQEREEKQDLRAVS